MLQLGHILMPWLGCEAGVSISSGVINPVAAVCGFCRYMCSSVVTCSWFTAVISNYFIFKQ